MRVIGLTGGIGSGKTTVAKMFSELQVPVYIADKAAKRLMNSSEKVKNAIIALLGEEAYEDGQLNTRFIASVVFNVEEKLQDLNAIVHPAVARDFEEWLQDQSGAYVLYESAILIENQRHSSCDKIILVTAPYDLRIKRLKERDQSTTEEIEARMKHQWSDDKKRNFADYEIINTDLASTREQVKIIHDIMLKAGES